MNKTGNRQGSRRGRVLRAARVALVATLLAAAPALSSPTLQGRAFPPVLPGSGPPGQITTVPRERLRAIVEIIDQTRGRAAGPGLRDEERDTLAELAWALVDEALEDPLLWECARRDPDFLQVQALLLMDDGEDEEALGVLERLRSIAPTDPETHRLLALVFMGLGRAGSAVEEYRQTLALGVGAAAALEVRAHLAYALAVAGRREEALVESDRTIAGDPAGYLGHFVRGWILGQLGRREEERREYQEAVRRERDDADLWASLAKSWEGAGDRTRAQEAWREVVRIDPSDEEAAERLGMKP